MNKETLNEALEIAANSFEYDGEHAKAQETRKLNHSMSTAILEQYKSAAFEEGVKYALESLRDVYGEGIEETDIWAEYGNDEEGEN